ncbi:MAG: hypothetical protein HY791_20790 [Deltaproteobacteria bacterium]|nr:hypothetical protein [Deltaproteobacteria bacterium]
MKQLVILIATLAPWAPVAGRAQSDGPTEKEEHTTGTQELRELSEETRQLRALLEARKRALAERKKNAELEAEIEQLEQESEIPETERRFLHGFRMGYLYLANIDRPLPWDATHKSLRARYDIASPHQFLIGYESAVRIIGHDWLNMLVVGNVLVAGLEQSRVFPSLNLILGAELDASFQLGAGVNLSPARENPAHMVIAGGWMPRFGALRAPIHAFFIPDKDGNHRMGLLIGFNWSV